MNVPETRYARSGDVNIAYQVFGEGRFDLVYVPGWVSNVELTWDDHDQAAFLQDLASFSRVLMFDKRGTGLSDRVPDDRLPNLDQRMDDIRAVMDAAQIDRAALFGHSEGGLMSILFAATYPDRTRALITYGIYAKRYRSEDYPWAPPLEERLRTVEELRERGWPAEIDVGLYAPARAGDRDLMRRLATYMRRSASPGAAAALMEMNTYMDVRDVLTSVRVPTLILHAVDDGDSQIEEARFIAARIPEAKLVELPHGGHLFWLGDRPRIIGEIQEFLTGARPELEPDRFLATVLFTDVVEGTRRAAELGDARWRGLIERHHAVVREELRRHRGVEVDTAGDGFFATFDGPGRAVRCAVAIRDAVRPLGVEVRAGLHTGECVLINEKVGGIAVIIGARVAAQAGPGEVLVSSTVKDLVAGSGLRFDDRGTHALKGVPGEWRLFAETPSDGQVQSASRAR